MIFCKDLVINTFIIYFKVVVKIEVDFGKSDGSLVAVPKQGFFTSGLSAHQARLTRKIYVNVSHVYVYLSL